VDLRVNVDRSDCRALCVPSLVLIARVVFLLEHTDTHGDTDKRTKSQTPLVTIRTHQPPPWVDINESMWILSMHGLALYLSAGFCPVAGATSGWITPSIDWQSDAAGARFLLSVRRPRADTRVILLLHPDLASAVVHRTWTTARSPRLDESFVCGVPGGGAKHAIYECFVVLWRNLRRTDCSVYLPS